MKKDSKVTWFVTFDGYQTDCGCTIVHACCPKEALIKIINKHTYGFDEDEIPHSLTEEELWDKLDLENGDGCNFIITIIASNGVPVYGIDPEKNNVEVI